MFVKSLRRDILNSKDLVVDFNSDVRMFYADCVHSMLAVHWS